LRAVSVAEKQQSLVELFGGIPDPQEKLSAIVEWSKRIPRLPASARTQEHRVPGCVSPVWVSLQPLPNSTFRVQADAESPVVRALVCALAEVYDEAEANDIVNTEPTLLDELGLAATLSFTRRNGLLAVRQRIRESVRATTGS
jgi:cysteine desulfuration protein SufE